jgi:hypothetical protein
MEGGNLVSKTNGDSNGQGTTVHLSLRGKGGVGKSLVASVLSQYFLSKDRTLHAVDAEPVNQTLAQYEALVVERLNLIKNGNVDQRAFDILMERMLTEPGTFVVDTGASTFIPLWNYLLENKALDFLRSRGRQVFVHTVITGGQASAFPDMAVYKTHRDKVRGVVAIVRRNADTFGRDVEQMISRKLTFDEAVNTPDFTIMAKQRLRVIQRDLFEQLAAIGLA